MIKKVGILEIITPNSGTGIQSLKWKKPWRLETHILTVKTETILSH